VTAQYQGIKRKLRFLHLADEPGDVAHLMPYSSTNLFPDSVPWFAPKGGQEDPA